MDKDELALDESVAASGREMGVPVSGMQKQWLVPVFGSYPGQSGAERKENYGKSCPLNEVG